MKISSEKLIQDLIERTRKNLNEAEKFKQLPLETLRNRKSENTWNILECFEHMNLFGDFYIPEINKKLKNSTEINKELYKSAPFGNFFAKSMLPREKPNKMNTFKDKNPLKKNLDINCIERFISQQQKTLELLDIARSKDLNKNKIPISISQWVKLKLGDSFRIFIYHNERHIVQANKLLH